MREAVDTFFTRYPHKSIRLLELIPPLIAMFLISLPFWGAYVMPQQLAYFIIFFDVIWLYKSITLAFNSYKSSKNIRESEKVNWLEKSSSLPNFDKVRHLIIIPSYKETVEKIQMTIDAIHNQTFPPKRIYICLALEAREDKIKEKAARLAELNKGKFGGFFYTLHPDLPGEVKGKSSNQAFAVKQVTQDLIDKKKFDINYFTVSSCDADSLYDPQFFANLTHSFLTTAKPHNTFWQSATVYHNNFWQVPAFIRVISFFGTLWRTGLLVMQHRLVPNSTYTLSLKLLREVGYWDTDVIPEDYRVYFKTFFKKKGDIRVEPIFLKTSIDSAQASTYMGSLMNKYHQERRWSWGVADDAVYMKWYLTERGVPFIRKTRLLSGVLIDHILWPVNWLLITLSANLVVILNPNFQKTSLGYMLPKLSAFILTLCLISLLIMIYVDYTLQPSKKDKRPKKIRQFLFPLEFVLMPVAGFFLSALPALITHIQLILGKRLEYKVTEKV